MQEQELQEVYEMVDSIPFSRVKKNIHRDFSDGLMMAELLHHYSPKLVNLHNYPPANSLAKKIENWNTLNGKALKKLGIQLSRAHIEHIANATPGVIEELLFNILTKFQKPEEEGSLAQNAKKASARAAKNKEQQEKRSEHEQQVEKRAEPKDVQAEQILSLVEKIDAANNQLFRLQEMSRNKDEIIKNLERKLEKIIFG